MSARSTRPLADEHEPRSTGNGPSDTKVIVVGAGGLGSYVGAVLSRAGHDVVLAARGEHARVTRARGLRVRSNRDAWVARPSVLDPGALPADPDLVLVAVKAFSLDEVAPTVAELATAGALVVPLMNGVDTSDRLVRSGVPVDSIVDAVAYLTAFRTAPGEIERKGEHQRLVVGSSTGRSAHRVEEVRRAFEGTGVQVDVAEDIHEELWRKMAVVCALAAVCGITGSAIGPIRTHPLGPDLQARAIREVMEVGRSRGVPLPRSAEEEIGRVLDAFPEDFYPSVLHDLRSGRPTEMEALGGQVARLGRAAGVDTPIFDAATCAVQLAERRVKPRI